METFTETKYCKYCNKVLENCTDEGLQCSVCNKNIHLRCLKRGSVPGGLYGDLFYTLICQECSSNNTETFCRNKLSWLQVVILILYHLQSKSPGLARKGFFHWKNHIASFIDRNWEILFSNDVKKKKKWMGTVAGTLSHFASMGIFSSGTSVLNEQAWWTLTYPKLSPLVISSLYSIITTEKQRAKANNEKRTKTDTELFQEVLIKYISEERRQCFSVCNLNTTETKDVEIEPPVQTKVTKFKRKNTSLLDCSSKKLLKLSQSPKFLDDLSCDILTPEGSEKSASSSSPKIEEPQPQKPPVKRMDPFCHYNTSLRNLSKCIQEPLQVKLMGGVRQEMILSPYSAIYLKPYIRRDTETFPPWLKLMAELQLKVNQKNENYELPPRHPLDYTYVQPEHIPAINSLCNQFFWPGIDLTESLEYPDFSCVVLYKKLIVAFAFLVPDVKHIENYISFAFTRPGWRNCGIAKFMIYHLIQTSLGKDITLHVSVNSPALFLYQKFGFKVEQFVMDFYDKYYRSDVKESKHAFFCRLER